MRGHVFVARTVGRSIAASRGLQRCVRLTDRVHKHTYISVACMHHVRTRTRIDIFTHACIHMYILMYTYMCTDKHVYVLQRRREIHTHTCTSKNPYADKYIIFMHTYINYEHLPATYIYVCVCVYLWIDERACLLA
jgi:hypothetical protein